MPRRPSRFLYGLDPAAPRQARGGAGGRRAPGSAGASATARIPGSAGANGSATAAVSAATADPAAVAALRAWRRERARRDGVPAYVIFSDRTLAELVARQPSGDRDLLGVYGLGPAKVERYGAELLAVLGDAAPGG
jgi:superfamily II DNA helicase RecQ